MPRRAVSISLTVLLILASTACGSGRSSSDIHDLDLEQRLASLVDSTDTALSQVLKENRPPYLRDRENLWTPISAFYDARKYELVWLGADADRDRVDGLFRAISSLEQEGMNPGLYPVSDVRAALDQLPQADSLSIHHVLRAELGLTHLAMQVLYDVANGYLDPSEVGAEIYVTPATVDLDALLTDAVDAGSFAEFLSTLRPHHRQYDRLRSALARYRQIEADGGWDPVPDDLLTGDGVLEAGEVHPHVMALRARLSVTGDYDGDAQDDVYDGDLVAALASFQRRHGVLADSLTGPHTLARLNVPVSDRIAQLGLALERWRWLPQELGPRHILVNIPEFVVRGYDEERVEIEMPVIVGATFDDRETPVFADRLEHVVFRPYWNVPSGIALGEILPSAQDAGPAEYFASRHYEFARGDDAVELDEVDVAALVKKGDLGGFRVRQTPGSHNALGLVKFIFPNRFAIYLHDTPSDHLFADIDRAKSHGCIRLSRPTHFAEFVFAKESDPWDLERIESALADTLQNDLVVELESTIPVYIMYLTAFVTDDGHVNFREDIYGNDEAILAARRDTLQVPAR